MYITKVPEYADLMTKEEFIESAEEGFFIDYDGHGYPVKDNMMNNDHVIYPSDCNFPDDATHIAWFNR